MFSKIRSKSAVKTLNQSIRKQDLDSPVKVQRKNQSMTRAYGKLQIRKKTKSTRDVKFSEKTTQPSPANEKVVASVPKAQTEKNLQRFSKNLDEMKIISQLILKSKSDKLDLARDLATYDFSFIQSKDFSCLLKKIDQNYKQLTRLNDEKINFSIDQLSGKIKDLCRHEKLSFKSEVGNGIVFIEKFGLKTRKREQISQSFNGVVEISAVRCVISVKSTMFYHHIISCLLPEDQRLLLNVEKEILDMFSTEGQSSSFELEIKSKIIPFLYLNSKESDLKLIFDEGYLQKRTIFYMKILGISRKITLVIEEIEDNFYFEIKNTKLSLIVEKLSMESRNLNLESRKSLKKEISNHLFVYKGRLVWGKHPFSMRENSSRLLNGDFLKEAFDTTLIKAFSIKFRHKNCLIKVEGFELKNKKYVKMTNSRSVVTIYDDSFEFFLIFGLQSMNFYKNFVTLEASLEIRMVADMLFNS